MDHAGHSHSMDILFHPYLVHFPIAFLFLEAFLIFLWLWKKEERYEAFSYLVLKMVLVSLPFVMLAGYVDAGGIPERIRTHFFSAIFLAALTGFRFYLRKTQGINLWRGSMKGFATLLLILSVTLAGLTGHLGGLVVFGS